MFLVTERTYSTPNKLHNGQVSSTDIKYIKVPFSFLYLTFPLIFRTFWVINPLVIIELSQKSFDQTKPND